MFILICGICIYDNWGHNVQVNIALMYCFIAIFYKLTKVFEICLKLEVDFKKLSWLLVFPGKLYHPML